MDHYRDVLHARWDATRVREERLFTAFCNKLGDIAEQVYTHNMLDPDTVTSRWISDLTMPLTSEPGAGMFEWQKWRANVERQAVYNIIDDSVLYCVDYEVFLNQFLEDNATWHGIDISKKR